MRTSSLFLSSALSLLVLTPSTVFAQSSNTSTAPHKHIVYGSLADPADTARKRSAGSARLQASKSIADKTVLDSSGRVTKIFEPDASGKLTIETDLEYSEAGQLKSIKQLGADGDPVRSRTFDYDSSGQINSLTSPEQGKTALTLDKNNLIHTTTDARGVTKNYVYDTHQRLLKKTYSDGSPTAHFRYRSKTHPMFLAYLGDNNGQDLQKVERYNKAGALDGTLQKYRDGSYATGRVAYDAVGRIIKIIYPDGRKVRQTWSHRGQLTSIKEGDLAYFGKTHYATGDDLLDASLSAGLALHKAYDASGRLSELSILQGDQVLFGHRYHYNAYGSVERLDDLAGTKVVDFSYDRLNRVSSYKDSDGAARNFRYDAFGNLEDASDADGKNTVDAQNRLLSPTGFTYDSAGEMTFDGAHSYAYSAEDRITSVDGGKVQYVYNAMGELIERITPKGSEEFLWLNGQLLAQRGRDGTWTDFVYVNGQRIASIHKPLPTELNPKPKDEVTYFVADRIGLARAAVTANGVVAAAIFSPFGKTLSDTPLAVAAEAISYSGEVHDPYTGLDIYQYRSYNPRLGRWMSPDPSGLRFADLTNPQSFNLYAFVMNDPLKYFDAHGLYAEDDVEPEDDVLSGDGSDGLDSGNAGLQGVVDPAGSSDSGSTDDGTNDPQNPYIPPVVPVSLGCDNGCDTPPSVPPPVDVPHVTCPDCTSSPGDPTGVGPGDPSSGDPSSGDPGDGDPGSDGSDPYDPGSPTHGPSPDPCASGCISPGTGQPTIPIQQSNANPLTDRYGNVVYGASGKPALIPAGFDVSAVVKTGKSDAELRNNAPMVGSAQTAEHLASFQRGGSWDLQRLSGKFDPRFIDSATILIGMYASAAGITRNQILDIENAIAATSRYPQNTQFDPTYTHLPVRNVANTDIGMRLVQSGAYVP